MPGVAIHVKGLNELRAAIREANVEGLPRALLMANKSAAELVVDVATPMTPRRHGDLVHSLKALASQQSGRVRAGSGVVPYAAAIHWGRKVGNVGRPPGNRKGANPIKGRPFLYDALAKAQPRVVHEYEQEINRLVVDAINQLKGT